MIRLWICMLILALYVIDVFWMFYRIETKGKDEDEYERMV